MFTKHRLLDTLRIDHIQTFAPEEPARAASACHLLKPVSSPVNAANGKEIGKRSLFGRNQREPPAHSSRAARLRAALPMTARGLNRFTISASSPACGHASHSPVTG